MAIVLPTGRPAIDIVEGTFERPEEPWAHLGDPEHRTPLEAAISAVGRLESGEGSHMPFLGTAFVVSADLLLTFRTWPADVRPKADPDAPAAVDFGRELGATESVRTEIDEVIDVDAGWSVALLRAKLPETVQPLRLSVVEPGELTDREVVLIGYPSSDARNDPALVQRIFRGVLDVKRLLPGRIRVQEVQDDGRPVLVHDCASTGGCGGGPLVDVASGEVVGIHFAGRYLEWNHAVPAWELAGKASFAHAGVLFAGPVPAARRGAPASGPAITTELAGVETPAERVAPAGEPAREEPDLAGIVLAQARPALAVERWRDEVDDAWRDLLRPHEQRLESATRAVGKLLNGEAPGAWNGTAFLVGDRLAMTAPFVAGVFADGAGLGTTIKSGRQPAVDFSEALAVPAGTVTAAVTAVKFIHPYFHVALLELDRMPEGVARLDLAAQLPSQLAGRVVAVVSFAVPEGAAAEAGQPPSGGLFIQPGKAVQVGQLPDESGLSALVHDCMTGVGSAGGPVVDLETGYAIGVHTHGKWQEGGFAQPTWELARDPVVWDSAIAFGPDPRPPWLDRWEVAGPVTGAPAAPVPDTRPPRWTVDETPPIDWALEEPKKLESLLVRAIDGETALYRAQNVGIQVRRPSHEQFLWREILKAAAIAGVLRLLVEEVANAPEYAGIAPQVREYL